MLGNIGTTELLIILAIVVLLFGASRLPELGRGLGQGLKSFKDAIKGNPSSEPKGDEKSKSEVPNKG